MTLTLLWTLFSLGLVVYPIHCHYKLYSMDEFTQMDLWGLENDPYTVQCYDYYLAVVNLWPYSLSLAVIILATLILNRIFH